MGTAVKHAGTAVPQANFRLTKVGDDDYMSMTFPNCGQFDEFFTAELGTVRYANGVCGSIPFTAHHHVRLYPKLVTAPKPETA